MRKAFCRFSLKRKLSMLLRLFNIQKALRANYLRSFKFFSPFEKLSGLQANEFVTVKRASTNAFTKVPQYWNHPSFHSLCRPFSSPSLTTSNIFVLQPTKNIRKSCHRSSSSFNFFSLLARFQFLEITTTKKSDEWYVYETGIIFLFNRQKWLFQISASVFSVFLFPPFSRPIENPSR